MHDQFQINCPHSTAAATDLCHVVWSAECKALLQRHPSHLSGCLHIDSSQSGQPHYPFQQNKNDFEWHNCSASHMIIMKLHYIKLRVMTVKCEVYDFTCRETGIVPCICSFPGGYLASESSGLSGWLCKAQKSKRVCSVRETDILTSFVWFDQKWCH